MNNFHKEYRNHYLKEKKIYPSVFALKLFLGNNPNLSLQANSFKGKKILDVGFGDGRDISLFSDLGFDAYGIEVDSKVVKHSQEKLKRMGIKCTLSVGSNDETGFSENSFDYVYSSAALMYLSNPQITLNQILKHIYYITNIDGNFYGTFTSINSHISNKATFVNSNVIILKDEFYKLREGQYYHVHNSKKEVEDDLERVGFKEIQVYDYNVDWFGTKEVMYIFTCKK